MKNRRRVLPADGKIKKAIIFSVITFAFISVSYKPVPSRVYTIRTIVIDAGHGGHDYGCIGSSSKEKNIALSIALKLGETIEKNFPDMRVVYTRKKDEFIELHERAGIANRYKADLFICIHCNSACVRSAGGKENCNESIHGIETYVMGLDKTEANLSISRRENSAVLLEKDYKTKYDGFDPNSPEANIIFTLFQNAFMNQSILFASKVQNEIYEYAGRNNRGVKQAPFLVLYRTTMPSVLIETGFLTNPAEEKYLLSEKGQNDVSASIFKAFKEYKIDMEGEQLPDAAEKTKPLNTPEAGGNENKEPEKISREKVKDNMPAVEKNKDFAADKTNDSAEKRVVKNNDEAKINSDSSSTTLPVKPKPVNETPPVKKAPVNSAPEADVIFYTVQIGASLNGSDQGLERFNEVNAVKKMKGEDGILRFTVGNFQNINDAIDRQSIMRSNGFKDAFVTAYRNNKRITLKEAAELLKKK